MQKLGGRKGKGEMISNYKFKISKEELEGRDFGWQEL